MSDFLTAVPNGGIKLSLLLVLSSLLALVLGVFFIIWLWKRRKNFENTIRMLAILQIIEFALVNIWYWWADYLLYPLPLYHCRIAKMALILLALVGKKRRLKLRPLLVYATVMGFLGAVSAFVYPDPDKFNWPHITHIGYFYGHFNLFLLSFALFLDIKKIGAKKDIALGQIVLLLLNIFIAIVARATNTNYSYFLALPLFNSYAQQFGSFIYTILLMCIYALLFMIAFLVIKACKKLACKDGTSLKD